MLSEELHGPFKALCICVGSLSFGILKMKIDRAIPASASASAGNAPSSCLWQAWILQRSLPTSTAMVLWLLQPLRAAVQAQTQRVLWALQSALAVSCGSGMS